MSVVLNQQAMLNKCQSVFFLIYVTSYFYILMLWYFARGIFLVAIRNNSVRIF